MKLFTNPWRSLESDMRYRWVSGVVVSTTRGYKISYSLPSMSLYLAGLTIAGQMNLKNINPKKWAFETFSLPPTVIWLALSGNFLIALLWACWMSIRMDFGHLETEWMILSTRFSVVVRSLSLAWSCLSSMPTLACISDMEVPAKLLMSELSVAQCYESKMKVQLKMSE